jgi:hypothetical protein
MPAILSEPRSHFLSENKWNKADKYKKEQVITKWYASERKVISSGGPNAPVDRCRADM